MGVITKAIMFDEIQSICIEDDHEQIFQYIFDHFTSNEVAGLLEHIKEEKGITNKDEDEEDDE